MSTATRRQGLKSASLACTALVSLGLGSEAGAQPVPATPQTFAARLAAAQSGQTILLASGAYGSLVISGRKFPGAGLTIEAQPGAKPVFTSMVFDGLSDGVTVKNVEVDAKDAQTARFAINIGGASRIALVGLTIHGPTNRPPIGMMLQGSDLTVADSNLSHLEHGINMLDSDRVRILHNTFHDIQCDAIRGASTHVDVIGNHASGFHPLEGDHPDFIQFWASDSRGPSTDIKIEDNVYERGDGDPVQGVFIGDSKDLVISGNALLGTKYNAISVSHVQGAIVEDNFVQPYPDLVVWIIARGQSSDITVRNNITPEVKNFADDGKPNSNFKEQGNRPTKVAKPGDTSTMQAWLAKRPPH